uniref:Uncharacterized protein n=1 Tax=Arundo donax TaxID=35708 RepID=A0A0A8YV30_ARUDO
MGGYSSVGRIRGENETNNICPTQYCIWENPHVMCFLNLGPYVVHIDFVSEILWDKGQDAG